MGEDPPGLEPLEETLERTENVDESNRVDRSVIQIETSSIRREPFVDWSRFGVT